jgi:hypothetical protein
MIINLYMKAAAEYKYKVRHEILPLKRVFLKQKKAIY